MWCHECGCENPNQSLFCSKCGCKLIMPAGNVAGNAEASNNDDFDYEKFVNTDEYVEEEKRLEEERIRSEEAARQESLRRERMKRHMQQERLKKEAQEKQKNKVIMSGIIIAVVIAIAGIASFFFVSNYLNNSNETEDTTAEVQLTPEVTEEAEPTEEAVPTATETPTPTAEAEEEEEEETQDEDSEEAEDEEDIVVTATVSKAKKVDTSGYSVVKIKSGAASSVVEQDGYDNGAMVAVDGDETTSWQEGVDGNGEGEYVYYEFSQTYDVKYIKFKLGNWRDEERYDANNRPKELIIILDDVEFSVKFEDGQTEYCVELSDDIEASSIFVIIESVYEGSLWDDTCISEIEIYGK